MGHSNVFVMFYNVFVMFYKSHLIVFNSHLFNFCLNIENPDDKVHCLWYPDCRKEGGFLRYFNDRVRTKSIDKLAANKDFVGDFYAPFFWALTFKDTLHVNNDKIAGLLREYKYAENAGALQRIIHANRFLSEDELVTTPNPWQPIYAESPERSVILDFYHSRLNTFNDVPCSRQDEIIHQVESEYRNDIKCLIRHHGILRRYMKGEAGLSEILCFVCFVIGKMWENNSGSVLSDESASKVLDKIAFYFDCVDEDYMEPVPEHFQITNRQALEEICSNKFMPVEKRVKRMDINITMSDEVFEFIENTSFIGGYDFFYKQSKRATDALVSMLIKKSRNMHPDINDAPYYCFLNGIFEKKLSFLSIGEETDGKRFCMYNDFRDPVYLPTGSFGSLKIKIAEKVIYPYL